jgi:hypothetical protein
MYWTFDRLRWLKQRDSLPYIAMAVEARFSMG